jgi:RNA polymerase sigma-70 factor (ECF subfamily)
VAFLRRQGTDVEATADIVSETYLVAVRNLRRVPGDDEAAAAWLCGVARNHLRNHRRTQGRRHRLLGRVMSHAGVFGSPVAVPVDIARIAARRAWRELAPSDRDLLELVVAGVPIGEIAEQLGCTVGTARMRLSRARHRLLLSLSETG